MVCFVPSVCLSIRKSCQRHDCSELGIVRNWVEHCNKDQLNRSVIILTLLYDGPNGSIFISIGLLLHNSEICTTNFGIRNCEV